MAAIINPLNFPLTEEALKALGEQPIVAGDNWAMRFRALDGNGDPVDLTDAHIVMTWRALAESAAILFERSSATMTDGALQIEADADQTTANADDGKGCYTIRFLPGDESSLLTAVGARAKVTACYDVRINLPDGTVGEHLAGLGDLKRPITLAGEF